MSNSLDLAFSDLRTAIKNVNLYRSPYINLPIGVGQDALGRITVKKSGGTTIANEVLQNRSATVPDNVSYFQVDSLPAFLDYVNLRNNLNCTIQVNTVTDSGAVFAHGDGIDLATNIIYAPYTLILPYRFYKPYSVSFIAIDFAFRRGLYLNRYGNNVLNYERWIYNTDHIDEANDNTRATVDFDKGYDMSPMYLNRLYLSAKTLENLANKLGTVTNGKLYLGSKNIANMTTAQKNAIIAKGWTIY